MNYYWEKDFFRNYSIENINIKNDIYLILFDHIYIRKFI
jgi:hypothetical protein